MATTRLPRFASSAFRQHSTFNRTITTSTRLSSSFRSGPSPPRLPKEEQDTFERLQSESRGAFSQPRDSPPNGNTQPAGESKTDQSSSFASWRGKVTTVDKKPAEDKTEADALDKGTDNVKTRAIETGTGAELHPHVRRGAKPEFEGDSNPKTGEVGGPKNEPLRWGHASDWSYNGRVTDF